MEERSGGFAVQKIRPGEAGSSLNGGPVDAVLGPSWPNSCDPKRVQKRTPFLTIFGLVLGPFWGTFFGFVWSKRAKMGRKRVVKSPKVQGRDPRSKLTYVFSYILNIFVFFWIGFWDTTSSRAAHSESTKLAPNHAPNTSRKLAGKFSAKLSAKLNVKLSAKLNAQT